jgi:hypothetical protein
MPTQELKARFIQPMPLQRVQSLPEGPNWEYEVKLDGCRALVIKSNGKVLLGQRLFLGRKAVLYASKAEGLRGLSPVFHGVGGSPR